MAFTLHVETGNAAFYEDGGEGAYDPGPELATLLRAVADRLDSTDPYPNNGIMHDVNGNSVGQWKITEETEEGWPTVGTRSACRHCGQDLEWNGNAWWDRGGNATLNGHTHEPQEDR